MVHRFAAALPWPCITQAATLRRCNVGLAPVAKTAISANFGRRMKREVTGAKPGWPTGKIYDFYHMDTTLIGEGTSGDVFKVTDKSTGAVRAAKVIDIKDLDDLHHFQNEVAVHRALDHPNIVKLYDVFRDARKVYLVMELCTGGELFDHILDMVDKHGGEAAFDERAASTYMDQILSAMNYMHSRNYMHRDIKADNLLLANEALDAPIKIIDFGHAKSRKPSDASATTKAGTPFYIAPEVHRGSYDEKCDIWSCGVITYILLCGYPPFPGSDEEEIARRVLAGKFDFPSPHWDNISDHGRDFISKMLTFDPGKRPGAAEMLEHPWLHDHAAKRTGTIHGDIASKMRSFAAASKMKKVALKVIAKQSDDAEVEEFRRTFAILDANNDGILTLKEMQDGLEQADLPTPPELAALFDAMDSDGNQEIDYSDFLASMLQQHDYTRREMLWAAFRVFDIDGDGQITKEELQIALQDVPDATVQKMLKEVDTDGDGTISFDEFTEMMMK